MRPLEESVKEEKSQADKMFEELGYEKRESKNLVKYLLYDNDDLCAIAIRFNSNTKRLYIHCEIEALDMQELQAINKKCEELGWL